MKQMVPIQDKNEQEQEDQLIDIQKRVLPNSMALLIFLHWYPNPNNLSSFIFGFFNTVLKNYMQDTSLLEVADGVSYPYPIVIRNLIYGTSEFVASQSTFLNACVVFMLSKLKYGPQFMDEWFMFSNQLSEFIMQVEALHYNDECSLTNIGNAINDTDWQIPSVSEDTAYIFWQNRLDNQVFINKIKQLNARSQEIIDMQTQYQYEQDIEFLVSKSVNDL